MQVYGNMKVIMTSTIGSPEPACRFTPTKQNLFHRVLAVRVDYYALVVKSLGWDDSNLGI